MATPDPFMDEIRIMSYALRSRACKELYKIPRRQDFIEVLWCLDDLPGLPERWCPAEVLHVYDGAIPDLTSTGTQTDQSETTYIAKGVIVYLPGETWEEQVEVVEFLDGHMLLCAANRHEISEKPTFGDSVATLNPVIRWRFREQNSEGDEEDVDWVKSVASDASKAPKDALLRAHLEPQVTGKINVEMKALRDGHASMTIELEKMKRELVGVTHQLKSVQNFTPHNQACVSAHCVIPRLRHKLALRMQACLKPTPATLGKRKNMESDQTSKRNIIDGIYYDVIKVRVECTLHQFEMVSRHVKVSCAADEISFFPEYAYTQRPSEGSTEFRVLFKTFSQICKVIGILSTSDQNEMVRKCGKGSQGDVLRMIGTYAFDEDNDKCEASFFPGTSCGTTHLCQTTSDAADSAGNENVTTGNPRSEMEKVDQLFPVLTRKTREWNKEDNRFLHKLRLRKSVLPDLVEDCKQRESFTLSWKRAPESTGKGWSFSLSDKGHVFGWLKIILPFVQVQGRHRCEELGGIATDDMWDELLEL